MRFALILARCHGSSELSALGPAVNPVEARDGYHSLLLDPEFAAQHAELVLLASDEGVIKRKHFAAPLSEASTSPAIAPIPASAENAAAGDGGEPVNDAADADGLTLVPDESASDGDAKGKKARKG